MLTVSVENFQDDVFFYVILTVLDQYFICSQNFSKVRT